MHVPKSDMPDDQWRHDPNDQGVREVEEDWSACMKSSGFDYVSRRDMFQSFSSVAESPTAAGKVTPDETDVLESAENCFEKTDYQARKTALARERQYEYFLKRKSDVESTLQRYEEAGRHADEAIAMYCGMDRDAMVAMYAEGKVSGQEICLEER